MNATVARLMTWFHLGSTQKSIAELDALVENVILKEDFNPADLKNFSTARENRRLDDSVPTDIDAPKVCTKEAEAAEFVVEGLIYRELLDVMIEAFQSPAFEDFHLTPFESCWDPQHGRDPDDPDIQLDAPDGPLDEHGLPPLPDGHQVMYGEIYTSKPMLKAHSELPQTATPHLETIIAAYMFYSDSTHLANFGNASLWPLYTFFWQPF
ncbi:hypothetical protein C8F04DRAFT_1303331 [Mycena alexandri]|uniref:Uncharacterized protein n=1 Tax=Mycena alexandri TaxID=1745969 RepID=A0AAD6SAS0_9AGAR|nr:hypothetical protein C8F04DRAFT_1303331 [Mycena alexandri]